MDEVEKFLKEARFRNFSPKTIETYELCLRKFFEAVSKDYREVTKKDVREFLEELQASNVAGGTIHIYLNAIKFFFEQVMHRNFKIDIKYCKRPQKLPEFLNKEEVKRLIESVNNPRHKLMISLLYGSGMRVSELTNLKICDLEIDKGYGFVRQGKGRKDRIFVIPKNLNEKLKDIMTRRNPEDYLFLSSWGGNYDVRSLQEILKKLPKSQN